jgi:D-3-phosphoglycerate dehydrogenase
MFEVVYLGAKEGFEAAAARAGNGARVVMGEAVADRFAPLLAKADAFLDASMRVPITDAMIEASSRLKVIATATTGSDHIARVALERRGIPVFTLKDDPQVIRNLTPAAELSWALVMALARRLVPAVAHTRAGQWVREDYPGLMLNGRTLGVVGCGRIGQWMARYAKAFGMRVMGYDPFLETWPDNIERCSLEKVAAEADILSVHVHLSDKTRGLIDADIFACMKKGAFFINTSRGALADEAALLAALESGHLGGAGLDVLDGEPDIAGHPLVAYSQSHDNLLITPHCGGFSPDAVRIVCAHAMGRILSVLEGTS